jgi:hypothetical protein
VTGFSNPRQSLFGQDVMLMKIDGEGIFQWSMNFDAADGMTKFDVNCLVVFSWTC